LKIAPVSPLVDASGVPFAFSISMAVHKNDVGLRDQLNQALTGLKPVIARVLAEYHVPTLAEDER